MVTCGRGADRLTRGRETPAEIPRLSSTPSLSDPFLLWSRNARGSSSPVPWWRPDDRICSKAKVMVSAGSIFTNHRNYRMFNPLTEFPHMRSRLRSTLWPNGREMRCKGREILAWRKDPETKWTWANRRPQSCTIYNPFCGENERTLPTRGLCVLWIYTDVCMFLLPKSLSACSYHQWPTEKNGLLVENEGAFLQTGAGLLTKYLASDETAMHRMWPVCPTCRSSVPFLPPGILCSFFPLSTSPVEI